MGGVVSWAVRTQEPGPCKRPDLSSRNVEKQLTRKKGRGNSYGAGNGVIRAFLKIKKWGERSKIRKRGSEWRAGKGERNKAPLITRTVPEPGDEHASPRPIKLENSNKM